MKNPSDYLNIIFYNKYLSFFIPLVNFIITFIKQKKFITTTYDKKNKEWVIKEKNTFLIFDNKPCWNLSYNKLLKSLKDVPCKFYIPRLGDIVIDLGAGIGTETLIFSKLVGDLGKVFAIEAHPKTFHYLQKLKYFNSLNNVFIFNIAIGSSKDKVIITNYENHQANKIVNKKNIKNGFEIDQITMDEFVIKNKIDKIDFLKINIEGSEKFIIDGLINSISIIRNIAVSCHDFLNDNKDQIIKKSFIKFLDENDFDIYTVKTGHVVKDSWIYGKNKQSF